MTDMTTPQKCATCGDAVTRDDGDLVGSDGDVTCPMSDRPHGPAVPDDDDPYRNPTIDAPDALSWRGTSECTVCRAPTEDEPCPDHQPHAYEAMWGPRR